MNFVTRLQKFLASFSNKVAKTVKNLLGINRTTSEKMDQRLVFNLSKKSLPSFAQLKVLPRLLSKKEKRTIKISTIIIVICLFSLGSNFYFAHSSLQPAIGGRYIEGLVGAPQYLNPVLASYNDVDRNLVSLIFNGLLKTNSEGVLKPDLAESFQISPDKKVYTFKIKEGIRWHDNKPFTVDDVIFTVVSIQDPEWPSQLKSIMSNVQVEKVDEQTIRFLLREPVNNFLNSLTFGILPQHKWLNIQASNATLAELNKKPIGTGPFKFHSLTKDKSGNIRSYTLVRNEDYHDHPPYIKELIFKFYGDYNAATTALTNKNIQGLSLLPKEFQTTVEKNKNLEFYSLSLPQYTAVFFNTKENEALKETKVRQALAYAINRPQILQEALDQKGAIIDGPILPGFIGYHSEIKKYPYEPATAEGLLDQAGWKINAEDNGKIRQKNKELLEITLKTVDKIEYVKALEVIKANWEAIGVSTNIEIVAKDRIRPEIIEPRNYQALLFGEIIKSDPYPFWHSSQTESPGTNLAVWANRDVDKILEEVRIIDDSEEINKKYIDFQNIIAEYVPAIFLYNPLHIYPIDKEIKGINLTKITEPTDRFIGICDWYIKTKSKFSWKKSDSDFK